MVSEVGLADEIKKKNKKNKTPNNLRATLSPSFAFFPSISHHSFFCWEVQPMEKKKID